MKNGKISNAYNRHKIWKNFKHKQYIQTPVYYSSKIVPISYLYFTMYNRILNVMLITNLKYALLDNVRFHISNIQDNKKNAQTAKTYAEQSN